jgi:hypothetical protein
MRVSLLAFALLCVACTGKSDSDKPRGASKIIPSDTDAYGEGKRYLNALKAALRDADRIVVTEQSSADDLLDPVTQPQRPVAFVPTVYVRRVLNRTERLTLENSVARMDPNAERGEPACIFDPHHTIHFYRESKLISVMQICFSCGQVRWTGSDATRPDALIPVLSELVSKSGMRSDRNWRALAQGKSKPRPSVSAD